MYSSLRPHELQPARLLCPWDFPGKNIGVGYHFLLQGTFPTQGQNSSLASAGGFFTTSITWESISKTLDSNNSGNGACVLISHVRLCNSMDCSPPGSSVHGIFQARILEWVTISFPKGSSVAQRSIPRQGRSPGEENSNPLQYSCLENPMDRGVWWATVHGVARVGHDLATKPPIQTFVSKVISLLFNMLSRFVIAFLPGSKHLLIS